MLIHHEDLFRPGVEHDTDVVSKGGDDIRQLAQGFLELVLCPCQFARIEIGVQGNDLDIHVSQDVRKDRGCDSMRVVDHQLQVGIPDHTGVHCRQKSLDIGLGRPFGKVDRPDLVLRRPRKILSKKESLNRFDLADRQVFATGVEEDDVGVVLVERRFSYVDAAAFLPRHQLVPYHRNRRGSEVGHMDPRRHQSGHQRAIDHA